MGATASLTDTALRVEPGQEITCEVQVHNAGPIVDQFTIAVLGPAASWATVQPATLNLYPDTRATVQVTFHPPRIPQTTPGPVDYGVNVTSREDPDRSSVLEGVLEVEPYAEAEAVLAPATSRGARRGRHRLAIRNHGNTPIRAALSGADPESPLRYRIRRPVVLIEPGATRTIRLTVRPAKRFLRGEPTSTPVGVLVAFQVPEPLTVEPVAVAGTFVQRPMLPGWVIKVLAVLLILALLAGAWYLLLKPAVRSAAVAAAAEQGEAAEEAASAAEQQAQRAEQKADQAIAKTDEGGGPGDPSKEPNGPGGENGPGDGADPVLDLPIDFRIEANADPKKKGLQPFTFPGQPDRPLDIADLHVQNPNGDIGILEIQRGGKTILRYALENFRDYDIHEVVPYRFAKGQLLTVAVQCRNPVNPCTPSVTFSGRTLRS